jgi:phosphate ABC transporter permease protein PstC
MTEDEARKIRTEFGSVRDRLAATGVALGAEVTPPVLSAAQDYRELARIGVLGRSVLVVAIALAGLAYAIRLTAPDFRARNRVESVVLSLLMLASLIAILTTVGIVMSMLSETIRFFSFYPIEGFFFGLTWSPNFQGSSELGLIPLLWGTLYISAISMLVSVPIGLYAAIYLAEFASPRVRSIVKPLIEVIAGIPTVVFGLFALVTVGPFLRDYFASPLGLGNSGSSVMTAGIVIGILNIPFISSLSDDIINAVPQSMRDGSLGLGATKAETISQVVLPAALPGIVGAIVFALPFLDRSHSLSPWKRPLVTAGLVASLAITGVLTTLSLRKDARDEAFQKHRAEVAIEGLRARELAKRGVLPTGGIDVYKNDPQFEVLSLYKEKCGNCHGLAGQGGDEGPDFLDYNSRSWILAFLKDPQGRLFMGPAKKKKGMKPVEGTEEELAALAEVVYAQTGATDVKPELIKMANDDELFSEKDCDSCHYIDEGDKDLGNAGPNLFERGTIDYVVRVIEAPEHEALYGEKAKMPGFKGKLTPVQIRQLAEFIVGLKKPSATAAAN